MVRRTHPKEGGREMPPDPDAIARAFMEAELAKDRPKADVASESRHPEPTLAVSSQAEVDAYLSSLDKQVTGGNLLTPFTRPNPRRAKELSRPFALPGTSAATETIPPVPDDTEKPLATTAAEAPAILQAERPTAEAERFVFRQLGKGKKVRYRAADGSVYEIAKTAKSSGGSAYRITKEGDPAIATITKTEILQRGQAEHWVLESEPNESTSAETAAEILVTSGAPVERDEKPPATTTKEESEKPGKPISGETETTPESESPKTQPEEPVREQPPRETVPPVVMGGVHVPENEVAMADLDAEIARLREEVASERAAFIAVEESQRSAWKNLTRIFRGLSHKDSDDAELMKYRAFYDEKILALQSAELEKLKRSGKTVKELRPEMAALIREFEFDEAERIYDARQEMRLQKLRGPFFERIKGSWADFRETLKEGSPKSTQREELKALLSLLGTLGATAVEGVEKVGARYNGLTKGKAGKYLLGATIAGVGAVGLGAASGGTAAAVVGLLALKRLVAGAGMAVAIEGVSEQIARARRESRRADVEKDQEARFDAMESEEDLEVTLGSKQEIDFSRLEKYLREVAANARRGEGARRRNELFRKSAAIFAGAVLGSGVAAHFANEYIGGVGQTHVAPLTGTVLSEHDIPVPSGVDPADQSTIPIGSTESVVSPYSPGDILTREAPMTGSSEELEGGAMKSFLRAHEVKRGESIWNFSEQAVQDIPGMNDRQVSGRFAKLVETKLQAKLDADPTLARAAGFAADANGKFSPQYIQAGSKLELGRLLSQDEVASLVREAQGDHTLIDTVRTAKSGLGGQLLPEEGVKTVSEAELSSEPADPAKIAAPSEGVADDLAKPTVEAALFQPDGRVMDYVQGLSREEQEDLFRNFKKLSAALFETDEVVNAEGYDRDFNPVSYSELAKTRLAVVLSDHASLSRNPVFSYDRIKNPLHWSQMEAVAKLVRVSAKTFGEELVRAHSGESIREYVLRILAIAHVQGVKIPGFRMVN